MTSDRKDLKMHRATADRLLSRLRSGVVEYNADPSRPYVIARVVVFGSYVNDPGREMLSDLDIGFKIERRYSGDEFKAALRDEADRILCRCPSYESKLSSIMDEMGIAYAEAVRAMRCRSGYVSLHDIEVDYVAIFSDRTLEVDVGEIRRVPFVVEGAPGCERSVREGGAGMAAAMAEDPILNLYDCDLMFFSEVLPIVRSVLLTGRSVYLDGDSGWLMAKGIPGEPDWDAIRSLDSMRPLSACEDITLVEGYCV